MNPVRVEALVDRLGQLVEARDGPVRDDDVHRRERLLLVQAPHVQLVDGDDPGDLLQVVLHVPQVDAVGGALQQDDTGASHFLSRLCQQTIHPVITAGTHTKRKRRQQNRHRNRHTDGRVGVVSTLVVRQPDHQRGDDDAKVVGRVSEDMEQNAHHPKVTALGDRPDHMVTVLVMLGPKLQITRLEDCQNTVTRPHKPQAREPPLQLDCPRQGMRHAER